MSKHHIVNALALAGLLLTPSAFASTQGLNLNFTAVIEETTCLMKVSSLTNSSLSGSNPQYALKIPDIGISSLINAMPNTEGSFRLLPQECNNEITSLTMTIKGDTLPNTAYMLKNALTSGNAENVAMGFKPKGSDDSSLYRLDGVQRISWSQSQIADGMDLSAFFRRAGTSLTPTTGDFQAKATFTFTYE
jgi:hypothetical protein